MLKFFFKKQRKENNRPTFLINIDAKIPQQNISKPNSTTHLKDHSSRPSGIYPKDARMVQHMQINKRNASYKQNQRQKPRDYLNRCRKGL